MFLLVYGQHWRAFYHHDPHSFPLWVPVSMMMRLLSLQPSPSIAFLRRSSSSTPLRWCYGDGPGQHCDSQWYSVLMMMIIQVPPSPTYWPTEPFSQSFSNDFLNKCTECLSVFKGLPASHFWRRQEPDATNHPLWTLRPGSPSKREGSAVFAARYCTCGSGPRSRHYSQSRWWLWTGASCPGSLTRPVYCQDVADLASARRSLCHRNRVD